MKRRVFNILSAVSLVLAIAVTILWGRSYRQFDHFGITPFETQLIVQSLRGGIHIAFLEDEADPDFFFWTGTSAKFWRSSGSSKEIAMRFRFSENFSHGPSRNTRYMSLELPHWSITFPLLLPTFLWFAKRQRRRRRVAHRAVPCVNCGYDLRVSKDKCPECGAAVPAKTP